MPWGAGQPAAEAGSVGPAAADLADVALLRRIVQGDQEAFGAFYDRHASLVCAIARRIIPDAHAQEECVQDVFMQIWRQADRFDEERGNVSAWLRMTARARAIDYVRRAMRRDVPSELVDLRSEDSEQLVLVTRLDDASGVANAMAELPREQYDALRLAYFEGLAHTEIALHLGVPLGTVKGRIRLALARLRSRARHYDLVRA
jgi:RNA polymerase sigma-70 factor (ECF subfamily)